MGPPVAAAMRHRRRYEQRLKELGIKLPAPPEPFGTYVEAVQTGNLLLGYWAYKMQWMRRYSLGKFIN